MRTLIMADGDFAARERSMLSRLEVGLADEGIRVIHAIPRSAAASHHPEVFFQFVAYEEGLRLSGYWRAQRLIKALEELADGEPRPVDLVHVFGESAWRMGAEVAAQTGASLVLEVWSGALAGAAAHLRAAAEPGSSLLLAPDEGIVSALRAGETDAAVRLAPWGVHTPATPLEILQDGAAISAVLIASGREPGAIAACIEGLARVIPDCPELMVFAESDAVLRARLWPTIKRLGIVDRFTLSPDLEARRELALRADILLLPEARGDHRTLTLDSMAAGMVVIAGEDPMVSVLQDGRTARLVKGQSRDRWAEAISLALRDRPGARALALSAREHVRQACRASTQVAAVVDAYEWMRADEAIPFQRGE
jgi:hypothetical protein